MYHALRRVNGVLDTFRLAGTPPFVLASPFWGAPLYPRKALLIFCAHENSISGFRNAGGPLPSDACADPRGFSIGPRKSYRRMPSHGVKP